MHRLLTVEERAILLIRDGHSTVVERQTKKRAIHDVEVDGVVLRGAFTSGGVGRFQLLDSVG
jgi:hypothetical protein